MEADVRLKELQALKVDQDRRYEPMRLVFSGILAGAGIMGAAIGIAGLVITYYLKGH